MGDSNTAGFQGFNIRQEIVTTGKLKKAQNVAAQQINQAEQEFSTQELRVRNDVKLRFYDVLLAQRNVALNQELEQIARSSTNAANDLYKAAEGGRSDVLQAQVESSLIQLQTVKAPTHSYPRGDNWRSWLAFQSWKCDLSSAICEPTSSKPRGTKPGPAYCPAARNWPPRKQR